MCRQVTEEVHDILSTRGYRLRCRGTIDVKGKGNMITFFLEGVGDCEAVSPGPPPEVDIYDVRTLFLFTHSLFILAFEFRIKTFLTS